MKKKLLLTLLVLSGLFAKLQAQQCAALFMYFINGTTVQFIDSSFYSGTVTYSWSFGDGGNSTLINPSHTYVSPGTYQACLIINTSTGCSDTECVNITLNNCNLVVSVAYDSLTSTLTAIPSGGTPPYSYQWTNGGTGNVINVTTGLTYCVTVIDVNSCSMTTCYIVPSGSNCNAFFSYNVSGDTVYFTDLSTGNYTSWLWNFGDGGTSAQSNPVHIYPTMGTYTACLTVFDSVGNVCDQFCDVIPVNGASATDTICGYLFWDTNGNGIQDAGENPIAGGQINIVGPNGTWAVSDSNGFYMAVVPPGTYSVYYCPQFSGAVFTIPLLDTAGCGLYIITLAANQSLCGLNFGLQNTAVTIEGTVFNDANNNGIFDAGESGIPYQYVQVGSYYAYTNASGDYSINIAAGTYNVTYTPSGAYAGYSLTTPGTISVNASTVGNTYSGNNFGIFIPPGSVNLSISIYPNTTVTPGFPAWYNIVVCNIGATPTGADVTMNYDPGLIFSSASPTQTTINTSTQQITWTLPVIAPGNCTYIFADFDASTSLVVGDNTFEFVMVAPTSGTDIDMSNNTDSVHQVVTGSWDPNNKLSVQTNTINPTQQIISSQNPDQSITYTINFQNTGTAPAVNVVILDELSADLDANSFQLLATSHNCSVNRNASDVSYNFSGIMLPDSTTNPAASHGFVAFKVNSINNLPVGHVISDNADIYFDFNIPVATNYSMVTMINATGIESNDIPGISLNSYPNPLHGSAVLEYMLEKPSSVRLEIYDMTGNKISELLNADQEQGKHSVSWDARNLSAGMYALKLEVNGTIIIKKVNVF